jgi:hypothetical protein
MRGISLSIEFFGKPWKRAGRLRSEETVVNLGHFKQRIWDSSDKYYAERRRSNSDTQARGDGAGGSGSRAGGPRQTGSPQEMTRGVLDANVLVSAALSPTGVLTRWERPAASA